MSDHEVRTEIDGSKGRYVIRTPDGDAEMTFSIASPKLRIVDHTGMPDVLRGRGLARRLMEKLVEDARASGFRVMPLCPYVNAERKRHPEWSDIFSV